MFVVFFALLFVEISWTTEGAFVFTKTPAKKNYFMEGSNASFEWKYSVGNKAAEFDLVSWNVIVGRDITTLLYENATGHVIVDPGIPAAFDGRVEKAGQATLIIKNVNFKDSVSFRCILFHKSGSQVDNEIQLIVTGQASLLPETECLKAGDSATFTCNATGVPSNNFTWLRDYGDSKEQLVNDGQHIQITSVTGSSTLVVKDIAVNDTGHYVCRATANTNQPNIAQGYQAVKQLEPVQEDATANPERYFSIDIGDNKALCCPIKGYPPPFVTWGKNGTQLQRREDKCLTIVSAKDEDFGNYTCSATDGTTSAGPYVFSLMRKRTVLTDDVSFDIPDKSAQKAVTLNWSVVPGAQYFVVKIAGNDIRDDVMCRVGKKRSLELHYNALVFKNAENSPEETTVCVKVVALNDNDDVIAKTPTCHQITIKSGQVTLNPSTMCLLLIVCASWKMW